MGIRFDALSKAEKLAVADYVRRQYESLVSAETEAYLTSNAKADPTRRQDGLRELIASDAKRVGEILHAAQEQSAARSAGFTLIELSIVLVIIGLIVGGVLVGQDLVRAAAVRATISQIEKYNTAVNTFRTKYSYLPGDIKDPDASNFGLAARGQYAGEGDGNGVIEGVTANAPASNTGIAQGAGETAMFWVDLSTVKLIDASFTTASASSVPAGIIYANGTPPLLVDNYLPQAKLGAQNWIFVYSSGGVNYFELQNIAVINTGNISGTPSLTVRQAYDIDKKMDDGLPSTGNVTAVYANSAHYLTVGGVAGGTGGGIGILYMNSGATPSSATTCYDNQNVNDGATYYSIGYSNGSNPNCALSFRFQ